MAAAPLLTRDEGLARIRLIRSPNIGPVTYRQLMARHGSALVALEALPALAARGGGRFGRAYAPFAVDRAEAEIRAVRALGARYLFHDAPDYPSLLAEGEGAPPVLIARGRLELARALPVALVGARNASAGARKLARDFARALAEAGYPVVSGLARGVDAAVHEGALSAEGGAGTIGVIASGIDVTYPPEHAVLQERVATEGLLLTELPPGTEPVARMFPARNRIIAGLAAGTVVVEAALKSGSLITARLAGEMGRDVMAVPGSPLDPRSHGCNSLIREGAVLVQSAEDVIELLAGFAGVAPSHVRERGLAWQGEAASAHAPRATPSSAGTGQPLEDAGADLVEAVTVLLSPAPVSVDDLVRQTGAPAGAVQTVLIELELAGRLARLAGGKVSLAV